MTELIENDYVALLQHDTIQVAHPIFTNRMITLYRIIATKSFELENFERPIRKYEIGGWVQSINNLDPNNPVWMYNNTRVFDDAVLLNGTVLMDNALVFGNAKISNSIMKNHSRVYGNAMVKNSTLNDLVDVRDNVILEDCNLYNSATVYQEAHLKNTTMKTGTFAFGQCIVEDSVMEDVSRVGGTAILKNCKLENMASVLDGNHENVTFSRDVELKITRGK